jgi:hypothetical protein
VKYVLFTPLFGMVFLIAGVLETRAQIVPVALDNSGFMVDAIWENNGSYNADISGDSTEDTSYVLVTTGEASASGGILDPTSALPDNGTITSPTGAVFQLQPYADNNVLPLNGTPGTLTLLPSAQASYSEISFLVSSLTPTRRSQAVNFTLNYTDGQSITLTTASAVPPITSPAGSDGTVAITLNSYYAAGAPESDVAPLYLEDYDFPVAAPQNEILQSITIDPGNNQLQVYAVSGIDPTPEPRTWFLLAAGLGALTLAARRKQPGTVRPRRP